MNDALALELITTTDRRDEWIRRFEFHLDQAPALIEALTRETIPHLSAHRQDRIIVTGGGYVDNMTIVEHLDITPDGRVLGRQVEQHADHLWDWLHAYATAAAAWITEPARSAPTWPSTRPSDPRAARDVVLLQVGWLIDHAEQLEAVRDLDNHTTELQATIRRYVARYGVHKTPRRPRLRWCTTCGARGVAIAWITNPNGSPKPLQAARCKHCGQQYREGEAA